MANFKNLNLSGEARDFEQAKMEYPKKIIWRVCHSPVKDRKFGG